MRILTICDNPIADYTIVIKPIPAPAEKTAAEFLQRVIAASCGATLPIADHGDYGIYIGTREPCSEVKLDGFRITTDEKNVYLDGNIPRGTLYAAYDFAEKHLGYRMFAPDCEVIPTEGTADIPASLNHIENPVFSARRTTCYQHAESGEFSAHCRLNDCLPVGEAHGGVEPANGDCHTFVSLCPSSLYFDEHPEYFSYIPGGEGEEGKRIPCGNAGNEGQLCLTNPDVLRIVTENVLKQLRADPTQKIVEVSQADNGHYCRCPACAAVDEEEGSHSGTMIRFVNAVAEAVEKEFPDVLVRTFAYVYSRKPPKITKARHNVLIRYCTIEACSRHGLDDPNCKRNRDIYREELSIWGKMSH